MDYQFDKVITVTNEHGDLSAIIVHDVVNHSKKFYRVKEMGMEDIMGLLNPNGAIKEQNKPRKND